MIDRAGMIILPQYTKWFFRQSMLIKGFNGVIYSLGEAKVIAIGMIKVEEKLKYESWDDEKYVDSVIIRMQHMIFKKLIVPK